MPDILATIVRSKREEIAGLRARAGRIERALADAPPVRDFRSALRLRDRVALIAEVKRRSPGAGAIRPGLDPAALAASYETAGAAALSVLTDGPFFGGDLGDLAATRASAGIPILRKDFTLHEVQVSEARAGGADAVLLIVRILDDTSLRRLLDACAGLGMTALVETHDATELERALAAGADVIGVNNRDLASFTSDLRVTIDLLDRIPEEKVVVSESGIRTSADVARLGAAGANAVLVGESLLRAPDPGAAAADLCGVRRAGRAGA